MVSISYSYGLFRDRKLVGIVTYGSPASPFLCKGVCGVEYRKQVIELNRLVLTDNKPNEASILIGRSLRLLGLSGDYIVVSYADSGVEHTGFVYQATNFLFTGTTKLRTDIASADGKHSRHHSGDPTKRTIRTPKHRYVTMVGNKRFKKQARKDLKYTVYNYPKTHRYRKGV